MTRRMMACALAFLLQGNVALANGRSSLRANAHQGLVQEKAAVVRFGLKRFDGSEDLERAISRKQIVRVPDQGTGFHLDPRIGAYDPSRQDDYRYARPYSVRFIEMLGERYAKEGGSFEVSSLVRTCVYQKRIARDNRNATKCSSTSHTTGTSVDILVSSIDAAYRDWFRRTLLQFEARGFILATEEHREPVFHIMVLPTYTQPRTLARRR
jgi:hypothetical protein